MADVLAIFMVFSIPLSAIVGTVYLKSLKLKASSGPDPELAKRVAALEARNQDLQTRVEVLETIVTGDDYSASRAPRVRVAPGTAQPSLTSQPSQSPRAEIDAATGSARPDLAQRR